MKIFSSYFPKKQILHSQYVLHTCFFNVRLSVRFDHFVSEVCQIFCHSPVQVVVKWSKDLLLLDYAFFLDSGTPLVCFTFLPNAFIHSGTVVRRAVINRHTVINSRAVINTIHVCRNEFKKSTQFQWFDSF